jgi:hypothetical protein
MFSSIKVHNIEYLLSFGINLFIHHLPPSFSVILSEILKKGFLRINYKSFMLLQKVTNFP